MDVVRWYGDNSELKGIWEAELPDILLFGGIIISEAARNELCSIIEDIKSSYKTEADFPIKWNFRGLEKYYQDHQIIDLYKVLLKNSNKWRSDIFQGASNIDFKITVSLIKCHGKDREILLNTKEAVTKYSFSNALMRVGLFIRELNPDGAELVLDWPSEGQRDLFIEEYKSAYQSGVTCDGEVGYYSGPLKSLGFSDSPLFACMTECSLLQFSDLIVGATREMVEIALGKKESSLGFNLLKKVSYQLLGAPTEVVGRGIIISPTEGEFYDMVRDIINDLYE
jgi:hypothetical protein